MQELFISSPSFENNGLIPVEHTGFGADISPELRLSELDMRAKSIAIIMDDMGHPIPAYNHWVIWNIPVMSIIPCNIASGKVVPDLGGAVQGKGYGKHRYRGPKPPFGWSHVYQFNVYALNKKLDLPATSRKRDLLNALNGAVLQQGVLLGHFR